MNPRSYRWDVKPLLRSSFQPLFRIFVYLLIILPSGSIFGINVKVICFLLLLAPALLRLVEDRNATAAHFGLLIFLPALFAVWIFISQFYRFDPGMSFSEYKEIVIMLASSWLAAVYFMNDPRARIRFAQMVLHAEVVTCIVKVLLLAYSAYQGISVGVIVDSINAFFGVNLMGVDLESGLGRIQFIGDGLIPLCIYVLLRYRRKMKIGMTSASLMFLLLVISLAFTFSRYFWGFALLAFCLGMLFSKRDRFHAVLVVVLGVVLAASFPMLSSLAELRFSADVAGGSDAPRLEQTPALERFFLSAPILGHGLGSHPSDVIRGELPYVYEVQLYALAGQLGLVGLTALAILMAYYFRALWPWNRNWKPRGLHQKAVLLFLLIAWLMGGLFNPVLLSSAAAMSYALIKALAEIPEDSVRRNAYRPYANLAAGQT